MGGMSTLLNIAKAVTALAALPIMTAVFVLGFVVGALTSQITIGFRRGWRLK